MAITKEERLVRVHQEAMAEFDRIQSALRDERLQCLQDRRFYSIAGAQWEGPLEAQFENKPRFEVNKIHLSIIRIFNEYRNNRITVDFVSKDGSETDRLADTCDGLYRADEQDSCAEEAYDNAFEEAVGGGFGAWRLRACYEDDEDPENERQRIRIEPIYDADSCVFFDLDAKRQDKSDATKCFVLTSMTPGGFKEEYGRDPANWPKDIHQSGFDWCTPNVVFIAEYYVVEHKKETVQVWVGLEGAEEIYRDADFEEDPELRTQLAATGWRHVRDRKINSRRVHKYILSGSEVLEDCGYIAGKCIPIVPDYGKRWFIDNVERCMGHVRLAKDVQRLKNMQLSKLGEISALSPIRKPIFTPEQVAGHATMWAEDNINNYPYLLLNPVTDAAGNAMPAGPVAYTEPPNIPEAMAALLQITEQDIQALLGNQEAGDELTANVSGKAVELVQNRLDMQSFIYMSNLAKAMRRSGEIWLSMAKELYVEKGRKMKTVGAQDETSSIELQRPIMGADGETLENDLSGANFDVAVDVGPSSSSKRAAVVRAVTGMMTLTQDPETLKVLTGLAMMNMEGEGIGDVREYFRKQLVGMGVLQPTREEEQQMKEAQENAQPSAQDQWFLADAQRAAADAAEANANTVLKVAQADKTRAETIKTMAETDKTEQDQALEVIDRFAAARPEPPEVTAVVVDEPNPGI